MTISFVHRGIGHPWEKNGVSYMVTFQDGDKFRAWYRVDGAEPGEDRRQATAYAESRDGVHWIKPNLGLLEFNRSKENNLVRCKLKNLAPFRDDNPNCKPEERYKAVARWRDLYAVVSPDGLRWKNAAKNPILTEGMFEFTQHRLLGLGIVDCWLARRLLVPFDGPGDPSYDLRLPTIT